MSRRATSLLVFFTAINMVNYIDRYVLAAVLVPLKAELALTDRELGWLPWVFLVVYMLTAPLFGVLAERYSRTRLVAAGIAIWSLATAAGAFATGFWSMVLARSLVGVGEAAYATLGPAILSDIFPEEERAARFTWFYLAIPVGSALGFVLGGVVGGAWGWRASFLVAGLPGLLLAVRMAAQADPPRGAMDRDPDAGAGLPLGRRTLAIFRNRVWLACTASYVAYTFAMGALSFWAPTLLHRRFDVSLGEAGTVFGGMVVIAGLLGTFAGGIATDRLQHRFPDAGVFLSGVTLLVAAPLVAAGLRIGDKGAAYGAFFVAMVFLFVNTSPVNALTVSALPASQRATGTSLNVLLIHLLGDAISPLLVGAKSDALGNDGAALATAMAITVPALAVSGVALWWARGRRRAAV